MFHSFKTTEFFLQENCALCFGKRDMGEGSAFVQWMGERGIQISTLVWIR